VDEESFDRIEEFEAFEMSHEETSTGFEAMVTIPLDAIGLDLQPSSTIRGDVGYIYDGAEGTEASARAYWSNNGMEANVVDDVPDESRLNPEHWGDITVE
jgi:hypothetical protein